MLCFVFPVRFLGEFYRENPMTFFLKENQGILRNPVKTGFNLSETWSYSGQVQKPVHHLSLVLLIFLFLQQKLLIVIFTERFLHVITLRKGVQLQAEYSVCVYIGSKTSWTPHCNNFSQYKMSQCFCCLISVTDMQDVQQAGWKTFGPIEIG